MKDFLRRGLEVLNLSTKPVEKGSPEYHKQKEKARSSDPALRKKVATKKTVRPEILYYLAGDQDSEVRKAVAKNKSTPAQADIILAKDGNVDVRLALAKRMMDLLPHISEEKQSQLYAYAVNALATLARDEVLKVRISLSNTLKDHVYTPPMIASQLAKDAEREVAEPILRFCVALADEDLLEIIADHPAPWVLVAIASREEVNEPVCDAIVETENPEGGAVLISNEGAKMFPETLENIIEKASHIPAWQEPLVKRKSLPSHLAEELAVFIDSSLLRYLEKRSDFDAKTREEIVLISRRRINFEKKLGTKGSLYERALALYVKGEVNEELLGDALSWRENDFVYIALALLSEVNEQTVRKIFQTSAPKPIVALAWRADLSMRTAIKLQRELGRVPEKEVLLARGGTDYPLSETELLWQLDFFGIKDQKRTHRS